LEGSCSQLGLPSKRRGLKFAPCICFRTVSYLILHYEAVEQLKQVLPPNISTRVELLPEGVPDKYPKQKAIADRFKLSESYVWQLIEHYEFLEKINLPRGKLLPERVAREIRRAVPPNMVPRGTMSEVTLVTLVTDPLYGSFFRSASVTIVTQVTLPLYGLFFGACSCFPVDNNTVSACCIVTLGTIQ